MTIIKLNVANLRKENAAAFESAARDCPGVAQVDTWAGRAEIALEDDANVSALLETLQAAGFPASRDTRPTVTTVAIDGMTCHSCEITVERKFAHVPGVKKTTVDAVGGFARIETEGQPDIDALRAAVAEEGYRVRRGAPSGGKKDRPSVPELLLLFIGVFAVGKALSMAGVLTNDFNIGTGTSFMGAALLGLVAGSSSCLAVAGGLMLSSAAAYRERFGNQGSSGRLASVAFFIAGRTTSYGVLGGAIGALGDALTPSTGVTAAVTVVAATYMLVVGLDLLGLAPAWLKRLTPRMPKRLGHLVMDAGGKAHPAAPFLMGAATFFIPCGFTQALQLYALTTGSFVSGASILAGFALGTAPALFALGWAAGSLQGKAGKLFLRFSGAAVIVLGLWNVQNGLTIAGHPIGIPNFAARSSAAVTDVADPNVQFDGTTQRIRMKLGSSPFYAPSDRYVVRAGVPVRLEIEGIGEGCRSVFQIPKFDVRLSLNKELNVVEFTPKETGEAVFSCAMGMFPGTITVVPAS